MANNNNKDYNYYKSEYGKFKNNYYTPGTANRNKKKKNGGGKKFLKSLIIFIIVFAIIALLVFGGIKIYKSVSKNLAEKEKTTVVTTTQVTTTKSQTTSSQTTKPVTTTKPQTTKAPSTTRASQGEITADSIGYISTPNGDSVYLRHNPTYDEYGYAPLSVGTKVVISEISADGKWGKTSNFDVNGWIYLKYVSASSTSTKSSTTSKKSSGSSSKFKDNITFEEALEIFMNDTEKNHYMICTVSCSINGVIGVNDYTKSNSTKMGLYLDGQSVDVYEVRDNYARVSAKSLPAIWLPCDSLEFDSWGTY